MSSAQGHAGMQEVPQGQLLELELLNYCSSDLHHSAIRMTELDFEFFQKIEELQPGDVDGAGAWDLARGQCGFVRQPGALDRIK